MTARRASLRAVAPDADPTERLRADVRLTVDGEPVELEIHLPARRTRLDELLPVLHGLADLMADLGRERAEESGLAISCRKGCGACCRQPVPITESEARALRALIDDLPESRRTELRARFEAARERLRAAGLLDLLRQPSALEGGDLAPLARAYFALGIACPFLEQEACTIHDQRPLACREFLVTSPAQACRTPSEEAVERVRLPVHTFRAVQLVDARARSTRGWTTLVLALEPFGETREPAERQSLAWLEETFSELARSRASDSTIDRGGGNLSG